MRKDEIVGHEKCVNVLNYMFTGLIYLEYFHQELTLNALFLVDVWYMDVSG